MKPYGWKHGLWRSEDFGPSSKHRKMKSKNRRRSRQLLHKKARNTSDRNLMEQKVEMSKKNNCELCLEEWWRPNYSDEDYNEEMSTYDPDYYVREEDITQLESEITEWQEQYNKP